MVRLNNSTSVVLNQRAELIFQFNAEIQKEIQARHLSKLARASGDSAQADIYYVVALKARHRADELSSLIDR